MTMTKRYFWLQIIFVVGLSMTLGCGLSKKQLRTVAAVVAVGIAAKLIYDMVVEQRSKQVTEEDQMVARYKEQHQSLPEEPILMSYQSSIKPGEVISAGESVSIVSKLEIIPGTKTKKVLVEEEISIYDNEDPTKVLKSLTKPVNANTQSGGAYENEFTFTLPKGMPQGVYPIRTKVFVNGQPQQQSSNQMQLVMNATNELPRFMVAP